MTIVIFALASMQGLISHFELEIDRHGASGLQFGELFFERYMRAEKSGQGRL